MKLQLGLLLIFIFIITKIYADEIINNLATCNQLYLSVPKVKNTNDECQAAWNDFVKKKDYFMQALMVVNGMGKQKQNPRQAMILANQITNANLPYADAEVALLKEGITARIQNHQLLLRPLTYCSVITSGVGGTQCEQVLYQQEYQITLQYLQKLELTLNSQQTAALQKLWQQFQVYNIAQSEALLMSGAFQGSSRSAQQIDLQKQQLFDFRNLLIELLGKPNQMIARAPSNNFTQFAVEKAYQQILQLQRSIHTQTWNNPEKLTQAQTAWLIYRQSFSLFTQQVYDYTPNASRYNSALVMILTDKRYHDLQNQLYLLQDNISDDWFAHPV